MTDISDASYFHMRIVGENKYSVIEEELDEFDLEDAEDLEQPIKKGTLCAAKFATDEAWYRASVIGSVGKGQYEVYFIDFGNVEVVNGNDLKRLPQSLMGLEPQSKQCELAFIQTQKLEQEFGKEAAKAVQKVALEKISDAIVVG